MRQGGVQQGRRVGGRRSEGTALQQGDNEEAEAPTNHNVPTVMLVLTGSGQGPDAGSFPPPAASGPHLPVRRPPAGPGGLASTSTGGLLSSSTPSVALPSGGVTANTTDTRSGAHPHPHLYPPAAVSGPAHDLPASIVSPPACASPEPATPTSRVLLFASSLRSASIAGLVAGPGPPRTLSTSTQDHHVGSSRLVSAHTSFSSPTDALATGSGSAKTGGHGPGPGPGQGQGQGLPRAPSGVTRTHSHKGQSSSAGRMQQHDLHQQNHQHKQQRHKEGAGEVDRGSAVALASPGPGRTSLSMTLPVSPFPGVLVGPMGSFTSAAAAAATAAAAAAALVQPAAEARGVQANAGQKDMQSPLSEDRQDAEEEGISAARAELQYQLEQEESSAPLVKLGQGKDGTDAPSFGYDLAVPYDSGVPYGPDGGGGAAAGMYGEAGDGGGAMWPSVTGLEDLGVVGADEDPDVAWHEFSAVRAVDPVSGLPVLVLTQVG